MAEPTSTTRALRPDAGSWLPALAWLRRYTRADFNGDAVAGLVTAIVLIPQGFAFALLAGLPPQVGLYTSLAPPLLYALFGTSRTLAVGPVSVAALMVAHALQDLPPGTDPAGAAMLLATLCGVLLLLMGVLRLGIVETLLSHPVLTGFTLAAAVLILLNQLPALLGFRWDGSLAHAAMWTASHPAVAAVGAGCVAMLLLLGGPFQRLARRIGLSPAHAALLSRAAPLAVVVVSAWVVSALPAAWEASIARVGALPDGLPGLHWPSLDATSLRPLLLSATLIALVSYVESLSIAKALAARRRERIDANQELLALGAANVGAALTGGMPVAGGFSRTLINFQAGARTQMATVITVAIVALVAVFCLSWLAAMPKAALAAIIIVAVAKLIDVRALATLWRYDRVDGVVAIATAAGVLVLGIETGIGLGIAASFVGFAFRNARPHIAVLGRLAGSEHFRNVRRFTVDTWPHLLFLRPDENLTFTNIGFVESFATRALSEQPQVRHLVLVMSSVNAIDSTALEQLERLSQNWRESGVTLHFTDIKGPLMDRLKSTALIARLEPGRVFLSAHEAAEALRGESTYTSPVSSLAGTSPP